MKRILFAGAALLLSALPYAGGDARAEVREARLRGLAPAPPAGARAEAPRLRRFPDVIGSGPLRPLLPGSGRTYADILAGKAAMEETTLRLAVFRVEFTNDTAGDLTTGDGRFDLSDGREEWLIDAPPHDSTYFDTHLATLGRFLKAQSYGKVNLEWRIFPDDPRGAYRLDDTADYLPAGDPGSWTMQDQTDHLIQFCIDAIRLVDDTDTNVVFSDFDGYLLVHAGPDLQTDVNQDSPGDIPSFFLSFGDEDEIFVDKRADGDSLRVDGVTVVPEYASQDGFWFGLNGVIAHEVGHQLGLPDLYNTAYSWPAIGYWGLMDSGGLLSIDAGGVYLGGVIPASYCAWSKLYLGWVEPEVVTSSRALRLACATDLEPEENLPRYAVIPVNDREYFLLENRCGLAEGAFAAKLDTVNNVILGPVSDDEEERFTYDYDYALPGWGLLVWHVNERKLDPETLFWTNDLNVDYYDRGVELEEADGIKDLGNPYSAYWEGSAYDPFYEGNAVRFGPDTAPNSDLTDGAPSLVTIDGVGPPGRAIGFTVELGRSVAGWPLPLHADTLETVTAGLVAAGSGGESVIAAFWSVVDTAGNGTPWVTVASPGDTAGPAVLRKQTAAPLEGRPVAGDAVPGLPGGEILALLGGRICRIDPSRQDPVVDLGPRGGTAVAAGPLLMDVTGDDGLELVFADAESLAVFAVEADTARALFREPLPYGILSNLAAPRGGAPVVIYVAGDGVIDIDTLDGDPAPPAKRRGKTLGAAALARPVTVLAVDLDGDGTEEIVYATDRGAAGVLEGDLSGFLPGWPLELPGEPTGAPFPCDRDGDGAPEIAFPIGRQLVLFEKSGIRAEGTPFGVPPYLDTGHDLGGNGIAAALGGSDRIVPLAADGGGRIWLWEEKEKAREGWPVSTGTGASAVLLGAVPGEGTPALVSFPSDGFLYVFPDADLDPTRAVWAGPGGGADGRFAAKEEGFAEPETSGGGSASIARAYVYPNPARGTEAKVRYSLTAPAEVSVRVHDLTGERVSVVLSEPTGYFGENEVTIRTADLPSGLYFVRVETGSEVELLKLAVLR